MSLQLENWNKLLLLHMSEVRGRVGSENGRTFYSLHAVVPLLASHYDTSVQKSPS